MSQVAQEEILQRNRLHDDILYASLLGVRNRLHVLEKMAQIYWNWAGYR
jgi:hypothetical protein